MRLGSIGTFLHRMLAARERFILPLVTLALLISAVFVVIAWAGARSASDTVAQNDARRLERSVGSVESYLNGRLSRLSDWSARHVDLLSAGDQSEIQSTLQNWVTERGGGTIVYHAIVLADGNIIAAGERTAGEAERAGMRDDIQNFGRQVVAQDKPLVSGRILMNDHVTIALGHPVRVRNSEETNAALVSVIDLDESTFAVFVPLENGTPIDVISLMDAKHRLIAGRDISDDSDTLSRRVGDTGWVMELEKQSVPQLLPARSYLFFAVLLVLLSTAYTLQEIGRRRFRHIGDERIRQVRSLLALASGILHANSLEEQSEQLATSVGKLVEVDAVRVRTNIGDSVDVLDRGTVRADQRQYSVAITGPHGPIGELEVRRDEGQIESEEREVVRTAAALAGAAMNTLLMLERERATAAELQQIDELRSNLLSTVSHELRSPITAVKGVLGLLGMQDDLPARSREYVEVATARTDRLVALIEDLFDSSLIETGQLDIRPERLRAEELLQSALGAQAAAHPGDLLLSATPNLMITIDPVRFDQLVNNLVSNAFRHGSAPVEVSIRPAAGDGTVIIVADEGPGIPPEDRDQIFGKFWQGSSGHARLVEGAGLGLSLVHGLVQLHGGRIDIDSTHPDGTGARFTIWLPNR